MLRRTYSQRLLSGVDKEVALLFTPLLLPAWNLGVRLKGVVAAILWTTRQRWEQKPVGNSQGGSQASPNTRELEREGRGASGSGGPALWGECLLSGGCQLPY